MRRYKKLKLFLIVFVLLNVILFGTAQYAFSSIPEKLYARALKEAPYDAVIIPGIPFEGKRWGRVMQLRVLWSKYLYEQGIVKNIIYSGGDVYTPYSEARIMALYAEKLGIPKKHIFLEEQAEHSSENLYYGIKLAQSQNFKTIAVASDPVQTIMLGRLISKWRLNVARIPMLREIMDSLPQYDDVMIDPSSALVKDHKSIKDRKNRWQRFMGSLGNSLNFMELSRR